MTGNNSQDDVESHKLTDMQTMAVTSEFKVLGQLSNGSGVGVLGQNDASQGTPIGVKGAVPNDSSGYGLETPDDAKVGGALETTQLDTAGSDFSVLGGTTSTSDAQNMLLGHSSNDAGSDVVGATIGGGGFDDGNTDDSNMVYDNYGTVGGGRDNRAGTNDSTSNAVNATIGGGAGNIANAKSATVGGGDSNGAGGDNATVGGGILNTANAIDSTVGGGSNNTAIDVGTTVGGGQSNTASAQNATVGGGRSNEASTTNAAVGGGDNNTASGQNTTVSGGKSNEASTTNATVGGGKNNTAGGLGTKVAPTVAGGEGNEATASHATVGGGESNKSAGINATVGGGLNNTADKDFATVGGGQRNLASEDFGTVPGGGFGAAENTRAFVWNDATGYHGIPNASQDGLSSDKAIDGEPVTGGNTFSVSATGGVRFITGSASSPNVTYIRSDSAGWTNTSSRAVKTNIDPVDPEEALAGVDSLEVATWEYKSEDGESGGTTHIGPMAEEFHDAFDVGSSDEHINSINADGVALAAIQGLSKSLDETREELADAREDLADARETIAEKDERIDDLESRLSALEAQIDTTESTPADD